MACVTGDIASTFRSACEDVGILLVVDCRPLSQPVFIDPSMWETIVLNLISNAFKFTLDGSITVTVGEDEKEALLTIVDTGTGIAKKDLPYIFDRFYRSEATLGRTNEGSGIGLALVRNLVTLHGGRIEAESSVGEGTTISVRVPFGKSHLRNDRIRTRAKAPPSWSHKEAFIQEVLHWIPDRDEGTPVADGTPRRANRPRILVVDDNADCSSIFREDVGLFTTLKWAHAGDCLT